jgi:hypothetical protein
MAAPVFSPAQFICADIVGDMLAADAKPLIAQIG